MQLPLFQFEKCCTKCGQIKPLEDFPRRGDYPERTASWCKSCSYEGQKRWVKANPDKERAKQKRYRDNHLELLRERCRIYHRTHKPQMAKKQREFRKNNPHKGREYYARNPERYRRKQRITNNRRRAAEGSFTVEQSIWQYNRQHGFCFWCSNLVSFAEMHLDHIIPVTRYGTNWISNIVCSCAHCNLQKGTKLPFIEWIPPKCLGR